VPEIAVYMALAITGGLLMQIPVGRLSDRFDRRLVAGAMAFAFAGLALALVPAHTTRWFPLVWLLLGGFMSVIYPVCVAHANDRLPGARAVSVSGRLILISGTGSALGPLLGASAMETLGIGGLFQCMAVVAGLFAIFALTRAIGVRAPDAKRQRPFLLLPAIFSHDLAAAAKDPTGRA